MMRDNMATEESNDFVLQQCRQQDVKFIRLWFTDILGQQKSLNITVEDLAEALEDGKGFDGGAIEGFARMGESDMTAMPDPSTFQILPWRPRERRVARMFCDIHLPDGSPFPGDPRYVLKRNLARAAALGFTFYVGPEVEFFYFKDSEGTKPLDQGGYFDLTTLDAAATCVERPSSRSRRWASASSRATTRRPPRSTRSTFVTPTR